MKRFVLMWFGVTMSLLAETMTLENRGVRLDVRSDDGSAKLVDRSTGEAWTIPTPRLVMNDKRMVDARPVGGVSRQKGVIRFKSEAGTEFQYRLARRDAVDCSVTPGPDLEEVLLLNNALPVGPGGANYYAVPSRLGILLPAEGSTAYSRRFVAYDTRRGYSMAMFGAVKNGSALLASWQDPYTDIIVNYTGEPTQQLTAGLALRKTARSVRLQLLGRGGYVEIAKAYRTVARERGFLVTLEEKSRQKPEVKKFFGAPDFKPFAFGRIVPNTRWNKTDKEILRINFTFQECADLAEHYKKDLGIDRALLVLNGWINGGYDNRHPDILPAAPEIGGDEGLKECSRRVKALGWLFGLHDNYQDMYKDAPSFSQDYIMKNPDGSLHQGGVWWGGQCWLICSRKSLELAKRPQNIPRVKELFSPTVYFSDTIFAAPPYECFDPTHPLSLEDDIRNKQELCDYLRGQFGLFGSEEGREWGVPHADYFEGLMSHRTRFGRANDTDIVIPMFEIVYGDAISLYTHQSDRPLPDNPAHILHHILYAEMPVYYFGNHHYWTDRAQEFRPPAGSEGRMVYAKGGHFGYIDQFIKNTYEVLSPLNRLTALLPMTDHRFLTPDRQVESSRFGQDVKITVNYGARDYVNDQMVLPQYGFAVESPNMTALYARRYRSVSYSEPTFLVVHNLDGKPHFYRAYGDPRVEWNGKVIEMPSD